MLQIVVRLYYTFCGNKKALPIRETAVDNDITSFNALNNLQLTMKNATKNRIYIKSWNERKEYKKSFKFKVCLTIKFIILFCAITVLLSVVSKVADTQPSHETVDNFARNKTILRNKKHNVSRSRLPYIMNTNKLRTASTKPYLPLYSSQRQSISTTQVVDVVNNSAHFILPLNVRNGLYYGAFTISRENVISMLSTIQRSALLNSTIEYQCETFLFEASLIDDIEIGSLVLNLGVKASPVTWNGNTPLHYAAMKGNFVFSKLLLAHKANPHIKNYNSQTPLSIAAIKCKHGYGNYCSRKLISLLQHSMNTAIK